MQLACAAGFQFDATCITSRFPPGTISKTVVVSRIISTQPVHHHATPKDGTRPRGHPLRNGRCPRDEPESCASSTAGREMVPQTMPMQGVLSTISRLSVCPPWARDESREIRTHRSDQVVHVVEVLMGHETVP